MRQYLLPSGYKFIMIYVVLIDITFEVHSSANRHKKNQTVLIACGGFITLI